MTSKYFYLFVVKEKQRKFNLICFDKKLFNVNNFEFDVVIDTCCSISDEIVMFGLSKGRIITIFNNKQIHKTQLR